jgi:hypothetical protein
MREVLIGTAVLMIGGLTLPKALASTGGSGEPTSCASDVQLSISKTALWPPNHKMIPVSITASESDSDGDTAMVSIGMITNSDETNGVELNGSGPPDAPGADQQPPVPSSATFTDGGSHTFNFALSAERSGHDNGSGRTYTIPVTCKEMGEDAMGNTVYMTVFVPHDQGQK